MSRINRRSVRCPSPHLLDALESRVLLSASTIDAFKSAPARPITSAPEIKLAWVAVHEFGHALGLDHSTDTSSIMYPYYNANYNFANFASDSAVALFRSIYTPANVAANATPWKDSLDDAPGDGTVTISYSWTLDGARMDAGGKSTTSIFDTTERALIIQALNMWAAVSNGTVAFASYDGTTTALESAPYNFGANGAAQNDSNFGDIRIAAHKFDGPGKTLAHTYYPPPNGGTAAGDAHFDAEENWLASNPFTTSSSSALAFAPATTSTTSSSSGITLQLPAATSPQLPAPALATHYLQNSLPPTLTPASPKSFTLEDATLRSTLA